MNQKPYIVIQDSSYEQLAAIVCQYMTEGYIPQGGISVAVAPGGWSTYVQAMVKDGL